MSGWMRPKTICSFSVRMNRSATPLVSGSRTKAKLGTRADCGSIGGESVAAVLEPAAGVLGRERVEGVGQGDLEGIRGAGGEGAQERLDLGPHRLDRAEIGRVTGQVEKFHARRFQPLA